jgi:hypothetical protein
LKNFHQSPFSKWLSQYRTNSTLFDFDIIGKRWPHVSKKDVTGKLAEALKPNLFKEL